MKRYKATEKSYTECVASLDISRIVVKHNIEVINSWLLSISDHKISAYCELLNKETGLYKIAFNSVSKEWNAFVESEIIYVEHTTSKISIVPINDSGDCDALAYLKYQMAKG